MDIVNVLRRIISAIMALLFGGGTIAPVVVEKPTAIYVDGIYGSDSADGTSENPVKTITRALTMVTDEKNEIYVIQGEFNETVTVDTDGVTITGAEAVDGEREKYLIKTNAVLC